MNHWIPLLLVALFMFAGGCSASRPAMPPLASIEGIPGHFREGRIIDLDRGTSVSFEQLIDQLQSKRVIFVGEVHDNPEHHLMEVQILQALMARYGPFTVAMEVFDRSRQPVLDRYMENEITETAFLRDVDWDNGWGFPYYFYRPIILLAKERGKALLGINLPHNTARKVARSGLGSLTPEERQDVAAEINLNNEMHRNYLKEVFKEHSHPQIKNFDYFYQAQCAWEETMAENIARYLRDNAGKMVVFTGNGHILNRFGVPDRVLGRIEADMATIVLYPLTDRSIINKNMADYVWLTSGCRSQGHRSHNTEFRRTGDRLQNENSTGKD